MAVVYVTFRASTVELAAARTSEVSETLAQLTIESRYLVKRTNITWQQRMVYTDLSVRWRSVMTYRSSAPST